MGPDTQGGETISDSADARARETEAAMTDEERFSLLVSVMGTNTWIRSAIRGSPRGCR